MAKRKADDHGVQEVALNDTREMAEPSDADDSMVNIKVRDQNSKTRIIPF